jgi:hypothetical protein
VYFSFLPDVLAGIISVSILPSSFTVGILFVFPFLSYFLLEARGSQGGTTSIKKQSGILSVFLLPAYCTIRNSLCISPSCLLYYKEFSLYFSFLPTTLVGILSVFLLPAYCTDRNSLCISPSCLQH